MTPADFAPYRNQLKGCACATCRELSYALSNVLDFDGRKHRAAAADLLVELRAGTHVHMSYTERAAEVRAETAIRLAGAKATGRSAEHIAAIERGYVTVEMSDFYVTGMGLGIGPRRTN